MPSNSKYLTSYVMSMAMLASYLTVYKIFANQIKRHKFDLEMKVKVNQAKNGRCVVGLEKFVSILVNF